MPLDEVSPYVHDQPVDRPELFVGRGEQVEEMAARVRRGESFAVLAGTRMGKTSLLIQLTRALRASPESPSGRVVVPVLLSTHQFGRLSRTAVFAAILDGLRGAVEGELRADLKAAVRELRLAQMDQDVAFDYFSAVLLDLMREDDRVQLFVQLDETDEFQDHDWTKVFFSNLRFLISQSEVRRRVNVAIAGTLSSADLWNTAGSPFYNVVTIVDLALLADEPLRALIPVGFPDGLPAEVEAALWREVGGHPYLAQFFLQHLWQRARDGALTADDVRDAGGRFVRERRGDFQRWWSACGREAKTLFHEIARSRDVFKKRTAIEVFADVDAAELALDQLSVNGLIREVQRNRYVVGSRLFARWAGERRPGGGDAPPPTPTTGTLEDPLPDDLRDLRPIWAGREANHAHLPPAFYTRLGARLVERGDPFLAVDVFNEARGRWPDDRAVQRGLGMSLVACGSPRRALQVLSPLREGGHADAETLAELACAHLALAAQRTGAPAEEALREAAERAEEGERHARADGQLAEAARCRRLAERALGGGGAASPGPATTSPMACVALAGEEELAYAEQVLDRAGVLFAVLPCPATVLRAEIAAFAEPEAGERLEAVLRRAYEIETVGDRKALENPLAIPYARRVAAGMARLRARATGLDVGSPGGDLGPLVSDDDAYRIVGLLFADAERFSQLDDAQNRAFGQRYLPAVAELAERSPHAPVVKNTWGDGLYMVFHEIDHAARFAAELVEAVDTPEWGRLGLPEGVRLRVGLHAGPTHALTDPVTGQFTYMGHHVSVAARIEQGAVAHRVAGSDRLVALAATCGGDPGSWEFVGRTTLPKAAGTIPLYALVQFSVPG